MVVASGRAMRKRVKTGLDGGVRVEILAGLDGDEAIVKAYASSLTDGQPVSAFEAVTTGANAP